MLILASVRQQNSLNCQPRVLLLSKNMLLNTAKKVYERPCKNLFWSITNPGDVLDKLKARDFNATSLSTCLFSTRYTTLPQNLIKEKLIDLI